MAEIIDFHTGDDYTPASEWMQNNRDAFERLMAIGFDHDGDIRFGANGLTVMECIYLLEYIKHDLMENYVG